MEVAEIGGRPGAVQTMGVVELEGRPGPREAVRDEVPPSPMLFAKSAETGKDWFAAMTEDGLAIQIGRGFHLVRRQFLSVKPFKSSSGELKHEGKNPGASRRNLSDFKPTVAVQPSSRHMSRHTTCY